MKQLLLVFLCGFVLRGVCGNLLSSSEFEVSSAENNVVLGEFVEVSEERSYRLSGNVLGNAKVVVGLMFYDAAKHQILPHQVNAVPGTETVLVETSEKNANSLLVADASKWIPVAQGKIVSMFAKEDLSDLPNRDSVYYLQAVSKEEKGWRLTFDSPVSRSYPAGTLLRQHRGGGWMRFSFKDIMATEAGEAFEYIALPAPKYGAPTNAIWPKAAYAKLFVTASAPVKLTEMCLEEVTEAEGKAKSEVRIAGEAVSALINVVGLSERVASQTVIEGVGSNGAAAFYQMNANLDTAVFSQVEFGVMAKVPGYFRFVGGLLLEDGKKAGVSLPAMDVMPDGRYHTIGFDLSRQANWGKGILTNWELRWFGDKGVIGLNAFRTQRIGNKIIGAPSLAAGKEHAIPGLVLPRAHSIFRWEGSRCNGATLRFYGRDGKELPNTTVSIGADHPSATFTTPEMLIQATVEIAAGGDGYPVFQVLDYTKRFAESGTWRGQWIWSQKEEGPNDARIWFRRELDLDAEPAYGAIAMQADDVGTLYVNGKEAGKTRQWNLPGYFDVTALLQKGRNIVDVCVYNGSMNGGLSADVYVQTRNGEIYADTDRRWTCDPKSNAVGHIPTIIAQPVVELGLPAVTAPWKNGIGYRHAGPRGLLEILSSKPGEIQAKVLQLPPKRVERIHFRLVREGLRDYEMNISIQPSSAEWKKDSVVTLTYGVPYVEKGKAALFVADDYIGVTTASRPVAEWTVSARPASPLRQARFVNAPHTMIELGGQRFSPIFWHTVTAVRSKKYHEFQMGFDYGFRNFRVMTDFHDFWLGPGQFDFTAFDNLMTEILTVCPNGIFNLHIYAHMPDWWIRKYPDEMAAKYGNAPRRIDREYQTLTSRKWVEDAREPLEALIRHVKSKPYAGQFWGATICENGNGEWFWNNQDALGRRSWGGYAVADTVNFQKYLQEKYGTDTALAKAWNRPGMTFAQAELCPPAAADKAGCGELYVSPDEQNVMDWIDYRSVALGQAICGFGKHIKELTNGKWLFGVYYGYFTELLGNSGGRPIQLSGHTAFLEVAKSPYVDFVHGPSRYTFRRVGMADGLMQPWNTFTMRGKTVYIEGDYRYGYGPIETTPYYQNYIGSPASGFRSLGQMYRAFGMMLATGCPLYWFDISGGALYERALGDVLHVLEEVYLALPPVQGLAPVEVAIVGDRDSANYTRNATATGIYTHAIDGLFKHFNELAVPFHSLVVSDLVEEGVAVPSHKCYIMLPTLMLTHKQRQTLMERFSREKATVLWLYAAAPSYPGKGPAGDFNADFLGIKTEMTTASETPAMTVVPELGGFRCVNPTASSPWFIPKEGFDCVLGKDDAGRPLFVSRVVNGATHYVTTLMTLPTELYAPLLEKAGVWRYRQEIHDPCWIGNDVLFIHAVTEGTKAFHLPKGMRLRAIVGPWKGTLSDGQAFPAVPGMTYGFLMEK